MAEMLFIKPDENIIKEVEKILVNSRNLSDNIVVFPNIRPSHYLRKSLAERFKKGFLSPHVYSVDNFINEVFRNLNNDYYEINMIDVLSIFTEKFFEDLKEILKMERVNLEFIINWGHKIFSDFEELKMEMVSFDRIKQFDFLISDFNISGKELDEIDYVKDYKRFSEFYRKFYNYLHSNKIYTRAMKYEYVADNIEKYDFSIYENIIFAGFFALTKVEEMIFSKMHKKNSVIFIYFKHPELKDKFKFAGNVNTNFEEISYDIKKIKINKVVNQHEEIFKLKQDLLSGENSITWDYDTAIILPELNLLVPLIGNVLSETEKFNISGGFSVKYTPLYSFFLLLKKLIENSIKNREIYYLLSDYIKFVFHPYVKNISDSNIAAEHTRKIFQKIDEHFSSRHIKIIKLSEIESLDILNDEEKNTLKFIHQNVILPFEKIKNINDFFEKIKNLIIFIEKFSTAKLHPYWKDIPFIVTNEIEKITGSRFSNLSFKNTVSYFNFLEYYLSQIKCPFRGSPLSGIQCLGFLEARNLRFKNLFILDVNENVFPRLKKEDSIFPAYIREKLGMSTHKTSYQIYRYYFDILLAGAERVNIYYTDNKHSNRSPFIENIIWQNEKKLGKILEIENEYISDASFVAKHVEEIPKNNEIKKYLNNFKYSASSLNDYLACPLRFYYSYVLGLREKDYFDDEIEMGDIGTIVHEVINELFSRWHNKFVFRENKTDEIKNILKKIIKRKIENKFDTRSFESCILENQITEKLCELVDYFSSMENFYLISTEKEYECALKIESKYINFTSRMDMIYRIGDEIIIADFKTSSSSDNYIPDKKIKEIDIENLDEVYKKMKSVQLPFYIYIFANSETQKYSSVNASVILLGQIKIKQNYLFNSKMPFNEYYPVYESIIKKIIFDILSDKPFIPAQDVSRCTYCIYRNICGRI